MAGKRIKGITVEIDGSTTGLDKALSGTNSNLSKVQNSLKDVNRLLKIDPKNTELLVQKQRLLAQAVEDTKKKLNTLKNANEQAAKSVKNYDAWKSAYTPIQEEIGKSQEKINSLKKSMAELEKAGKVDISEYKALGEELKNEESHLKDLKKSAKEVNDEFGNPISHEQYDALQREIIETEQQLKILEKQAKQTSSVLGAHMQDTGQKISDAGKKISDVGQKLLPVTGGITAVGAAALKTSSDFESAISDVAATMGKTTDEITNLKEKAREMGETTSFSATEAAQGLNILAMSGLDAEEQIAAIKPVLDLAAAGTLSLESAAAYAMGAVKGFGDSCENTQYYTDMMAKGATLANTDVNRLGEAMSGSAATARSYGQSADNTTLAILRLAEQNVTGSEATTALNRAMADLFTPTDEAKKALDNLGVSAYNLDGSARDINNIIDDLSAAMVGMSDEEANVYKSTIFTTEGLSAFNKMAATSKESVDSFRAGLATASDGIGSAAEQSETKLNNLKGQVTILKSAISEAAISIGEVLTPIIKEIVSKIQEWTNKFNALSDGQKRIIVIVAAVVAAIGPLLIIIGKVVSSVGAIISVVGFLLSNLSLIVGVILPIIAAIAAAITIGVLLYRNWDTIKEKCSEIWESIKEKISTVIEAVRASIIEKFESAKQAAADIFTSIKDTLSNIMETIKNVIQVAVMFIAEIIVTSFELITLPWMFVWENCKEYVFEAWEVIKTTISNVLTAVSQIISNVLTTISTTISSVWNSVISFLMPILENIKLVFSTVWNEIATIISTVLSVISNVVLTVWNGIQSIITNVLSTINSIVSSIFNAVKSVITNIMNSIKSVISSVWNSICSVVSGAINTVKTTISSGLNAAKSTVTGVLNAIKSTFSSVLNGALNIVKGVIDKIKSAFNFSWSLPKLKLPHISISGGFSINPPSVPKFGISWYKKAYDKAMVMDMPTIFGYSDKTGRLLGGGDGNGREVISGEDHLINLIGKVVSGQNGQIGDHIENLTAVVQKGFPAVIKSMEKDVVLDSGALVGKLAPKMDIEFGMNTWKNRRRI